MTLRTVEIEFNPNQGKLVKNYRNITKFYFWEEFFVMHIAEKLIYVKREDIHSIKIDEM